MQHSVARQEQRDTSGVAFEPLKVALQFDDTENIDTYQKLGGELIVRNIAYFFADLSLIRVKF